MSIKSAVRSDRRPGRRPAAAAIALALGSPASLAETFNAANVAALIEAINSANKTAATDTIELTGDTFVLAASNNTTDGNNGLPSITSTIVINGGGASIERDGNAAETFRLFHISASGDLTLSGVSVQGGVAADTDPGSFRDVVGGAVLNRGALTLSDSTLSGNSATYGGGLANVSGAVTLSNSTVADNAASFGGGLYDNAGLLTLSNSTVSGNSATSLGGGLYSSESTAVLNNSTFAANVAGGNSGGIYSIISDVTLNNSVVANGASGDCVSSDSNSVFAATHSFIENNDSACGIVDSGDNRVGVDPLLGGLTDNGGPTRTLLPQSGSPLIDAGDNSLAIGLATDQRGVGFARRVGAAVDVGATEVQAFSGGAIFNDGFE